LITDEKLVNTIKLISLKNALDFNNNIKFDVVISKTFSFSKISKSNVDVKSLIPEIKNIVSDLSLLSFDEKNALYGKIMETSNHYLNDSSQGIDRTGSKTDNKNKKHEKTNSDPRCARVGHFRTGGCESLDDYP